MIEGSFEVQEAQRMPSGIVHFRVAFKSDQKSGEANRDNAFCVFIFDLDDPRDELEVDNDNPTVVPAETARVALAYVGSLAQEIADQLAAVDAH